METTTWVDKTVRPTDRQTDRHKDGRTVTWPAGRPDERTNYKLGSQPTNQLALTEPVVQSSIQLASRLTHARTHARLPACSYRPRGVEHRLESLPPISV